MSRAILAEWTKFRSLRSTYWILIITAAITIALGVSLLAGILQRYDQQRTVDVDPAGHGIWLHGLNLGQVILAVLGVLLATSEYTTGTIRATLTAIPSRWRVLIAKTLGFGGLSLLLGALLATVMAIVAKPMLARRGLDVALTDPAVLRGIGLAGLTTALLGLLGLGTGLLIRHTAGALTTLLVVLLGVPVIEPFVPEDWPEVLRYLPAESTWAMYTPNAHWLSSGPAAAVAVGWVLVVLAAATVTFHRRDA